jgi:hypothetical protein
MAMTPDNVRVLAKGFRKMRIHDFLKYCSVLLILSSPLGMTTGCGGEPAPQPKPSLAEMTPEAKAQMEKFKAAAAGKVKKTKKAHR